MRRKKSKSHLWRKLWKGWHIIVMCQTRSFIMSSDRIFIDFVTYLPAPFSMNLENLIPHTTSSCLWKRRCFLCRSWGPIQASSWEQSSSIGCTLGLVCSEAVRTFRTWLSFWISMTDFLPSHSCLVGLIAVVTDKFKCWLQGLLMFLFRIGCTSMCV